MLTHRLRRWPNINPTLGRGIVLAGICFKNSLITCTVYLICFQTGDGAGDAVFGAVDSGEPEYKDEGYMELLLRVMAGMCDGQNKTIQVTRETT